MPELFESRDLSDAVFWGVYLRRATFRDADFTGSRMFHVRLDDVDIDGDIERLVVNGVDVTDYVNEHDVWFALRSRVVPTDVDNMREGWRRFAEAWEEAIERAQSLPCGHLAESVDGQWSFVQTVRHLVMATDKWFTAPILGERFHPLGLPNTGSTDFPWPGIDPAADPAYEEVVAAWNDRAGRVRTYLDDAEPAALDAQVEVLENGTSTVRDCIGVVFEEHFEHLRYALRDLDQLS